MAYHVPKVFFGREVWRQIVAQSAGMCREAGGMLLGTWTRYHNIRVRRQVGLAHAASDEDRVIYDENEAEHARAMADEMYGPHDHVIGEWHVHPYTACTVEALLPQISDDWEDSNSDVSEMRNREVELIMASFPAPDYVVPATGGMIMQRVVAQRVCRGEVWYCVQHGTIRPCHVALL